MFGVVSITPRPTQEAPKHEIQHDRRLSPLRQFFTKWECPAAEYAVDFLAVADKYALDWRLRQYVPWAHNSPYPLSIASRASTRFSPRIIRMRIMRKK